MTDFSIHSVDTKLEAYKLIYDPTRLLNLLYSKYGDIEDDYLISFINQLIFNIPTKYNRTYKESLYINNIQEFLRRYYRKYEVKDRIVKLGDYYKNYLKFFCRPFFKQIKMGKIVHNFQDKKAEIFYKENYNDTLEYEKEKDKKENSDKKSSDELSSLDNITNNKIIFDERTKKMIDNDLKNDMLTLTLESSRMNNININNKDNFNNILYKGELISKRSNAENSFEKVIHYLVHSQFKKRIENKKKNKISTSKRKLVSSPSSHPPYIAKIFKNNNCNINSLNREMIPKNKKIKNSLYTLAKKNFIRSGVFQNYNYNKGFLSPKISKNNININANNIINSKYENIKSYKPNSYMNSFQNNSKKNKVNYQKNNNNNKIFNAKNSNTFNTNTLYKNFSNLSETLNKYKQLSFKNSNMTTFTNKNNSNISKSKKAIGANSSNIIRKSNNNISNIKKLCKTGTNRINKSNNLKMKQNNNYNIPLNSNINLNMKINKLPLHHTKNKTFDFNSFYSNEQLTKYNTNNNFYNFRIFYINRQQKKKISSKFNLIKKPITEVVSRIVSPSHKKNDNKINKEKSISHRKDKTKKIFFGLNKLNKSNNIKTKMFDSPKIFPVTKKNITYSSEENNKNENENLDKEIKKFNNNYKTNRRQFETNTYAKMKENINKRKNKTSCASPLSNYTSNYNKLIKNKNHGSFNNRLKLDNHSLHKKEDNKAFKKTSYNKINEIEIKNNKFNHSNRINNEIFEIVNENQIFSRNKKQNTSKMSSTKSQNEINLKDICIKSIKKFKRKSIGYKKSYVSMNNRTYLNKNKKNNFINYNFNKINSSSQLQNSPKKNILSKIQLKRISLKKKFKKFSQRMSSKNTKNNFNKKQNDNNNKINFIFNGDVIINKNQLIEIKQNSINNKNINNKDNNKNKNGILQMNNTNKDRDSLKIINVNRNINLINKKLQNLNT